MTSARSSRPSPVTDAWEARARTLNLVSLGGGRSGIAMWLGDVTEVRPQTCAGAFGARVTERGNYHFAAVAAGCQVLMANIAN